MVLGGVVTKSAFSKTNPVFLDGFFDTKLILSQHPQQVFCYFHHFVPQNFGKLKTFSNIWMFIHHHLKFGWILLKNDGEFISQSWPLKTQFSQLSHSAMWVEYQLTPVNYLVRYVIVLQCNSCQKPPTSHLPLKSSQL